MVIESKVDDADWNGLTQTKILLLRNFKVASSRTFIKLLFPGVLETYTFLSVFNFCRFVDVINLCSKHLK